MFADESNGREPVSFATIFSNLLELNENRRC
jgi:hypothetical protein